MIRCGFMTLRGSKCMQPVYKVGARCGMHSKFPPGYVHQHTAQVFCAAVCYDQKACKNFVRHFGDLCNLHKKRKAETLLQLKKDVEKLHDLILELRTEINDLKDHSVVSNIKLEYK